jgi:hypothetical protein
VSDVVGWVGQVTDSEHKRAHCTDHLLPMKAVDNPQVVLQEVLILDEEREVEYGDVVFKERRPVLRQAQAVLDPVLDGRALRQVTMHPLR